MAGLALAQLAVAYALRPAWGAGLASAMLAELATGREAAIPLALVTGIPPLFVAMASIAQNLALAALLVPLVGQAVERSAQRQSFAARFMRGLHESALERLARARSAWTLFAFMLVPFIANGPILAGAIGTMAGLPARRMVPAIVAAVVLTATAWTYGYHALAAALASIDERLALVPAVLAGALALLWMAAATRRAIQSPRTQASP